VKCKSVSSCGAAKTSWLKNLRTTFQMWHVITLLFGVQSSLIDLSLIRRRFQADATSSLIDLSLGNKIGINLWDKSIINATSHPHELGHQYIQVPPTHMSPPPILVAQQVSSTSLIPLLQTQYKTHCAHSAADLQSTRSGGG